METVYGFCEACFEMAETSRIERVEETAYVRGVEVPVQNEYPICPRCGARLSTPEYDDKNLQHAYDAYRLAFDIPASDEVRGIRESYGMSQRQFAALLGMGVASVQRYERGSLPTESHAELLRQARNPRYLARRLREHPKGLSEKDVAAMRPTIEEREGKTSRYEYYLISLADELPSSCDEFTGGVVFESDRLRDVLSYLAQNVHDLYKTKLNKTLFYLDFSTFRDLGHGFTGLRYAHADYGPVPDGYELWMPLFIDGKKLEYEERQDGGQVIKPLSGPRGNAFSHAEIVQLKKLTSFVNEFESVGDLSDYSHNEDAWKCTESGDLISYRFAQSLKGVAR